MDGSVRLVHTSDLHLFAARAYEEDLAMVRRLTATVRALEADVVAVAGDLFDHNRVPDRLAADLLEALAEPGVPIVVLPGNHDPLTPNSVYRRVDRPANLFVLGLDGPSLSWDGRLEISGRAHLDYGDFPPLPEDVPPAQTAPVAQVVVAHGHYDLAGDASARHRPGWLITAEDLDRLAVDYVALGHWDRAYEVRPAGPATYYSGSPWLTEAVNVVDLRPGTMDVRRTELLDPLAIT
jgi:DNA repair exonuclease SbcCD nuclease subunit